MLQTFLKTGYFVSSLNQRLYDVQGNHIWDTQSNSKRFSFELGKKLHETTSVSFAFDHIDTDTDIEFGTIQSRWKHLQRFFYQVSKVCNRKFSLVTKVCRQEFVLVTKQIL